MNAAGDEIVTRTFGRGGSQNRSLELVEALLPHLLTEELDDLAAQNEVLVKLLATEIEEAVLETHVLRLIGLLVGNVDRSHFRGGLHHELVRLDFDFTGGQIGIDRVRRTKFHLAGHGDDALEMGLLDKTEETAARMHDDLRKTVMVAEVDEKDSAMVAKTEHPAGKPNRLARVCRAEFIARMSTIWMHYSFSIKICDIIP